MEKDVESEPMSGTSSAAYRSGKHPDKKFVKFVVIAGIFLSLALVFIVFFFILFLTANSQSDTKHRRPFDLDTKNGLPNASSFCYDDSSCDASTWSGICADGKEQSPIDIRTKIRGIPGYFIRPRVEFQLNEKYQVKVLHEFYAQNNGHTVQLELTPNIAALASDLVISGGGLKDSYKFAQLHFHWAEADSDGSEHTLNGKRFPLELHLVHYKSTYDTLAEAFAADADREAIAAMAVFFHIEPTDDVVMNPIVEALSYLEFPGNVTEFHLDINIGSLYPNLTQAHYARYRGSLTTPTCKEIVIWTIFLESLGISEHQMEAFRHLRNSHGVSDFNYRPLQKRNGRQIELFL